MNIRQQINKLQIALISKGKVYKINTHQFYSKEQNRMITGYRVTEKRPYKKRNNEIGEKDFELLSTYSPVELLKWLAEEWEKANDNKKG